MLALSTVWPSTSIVVLVRDRLVVRICAWNSAAMSFMLCAFLAALESSSDAGWVSPAVAASLSCSGKT